MRRFVRTAAGFVKAARIDLGKASTTRGKPVKIEKPKFGRGFISGGRIACANNNDWRACGGGNRAARQFRVRRDRPVLP